MKYEKIHRPFAVKPSLKHFPPKADSLLMSAIPEGDPEASSTPADKDGDLGFSFASDELARAAVDFDIQADEALLIQKVVTAPPSFPLTGRSVLDLVVPEDRQRLREVAEQVLVEGGIRRLRVRVDMGDKPYALLGVAQLAGETSLGISALFLADSESMYGADIDEAALYRELFERLPISVYFKDREARIVRANTNLVRSYGFTHLRDIVGASDEDLFQDREQNADEHSDRAVLKSGMPIVGVTQVEPTTEGSNKVVHVSRYPIRGRDGQIVGTMGFSHDVTQSSRVVEALARSEQRYALATKASRDGIWDYSLESDSFELSPRMCELLGTAITTEPLSATEARAWIVPHDQDRLNRSFRDLITGDTEAVEELVCVKTAEGSNRWLELVGTALRVDGRAVRLIGSAADVTDDREREARLNHLARHDPLTSLANRRLILERLNEVLEQNRPAVLLSLDLDHFKVINDSLGHQAGDDVLRQIAERLSDVAGSDHLLGRLGGDEFALLINDGDIAVAEEIATQMIRHVRKELTVSGLDLFTTASIGLVAIDDTYTDANQAFRDADIALYRAKANGRSRYEIFRPELRVAADDELDRQVVVRRAVQNNDFFLMYQPIFDAVSRQVTGVEALLRLTPGNGETETPAAFLPYLEQTELIFEVGAWVIDEALRTLSSWRADNLVGDEFRMALNVSRKQFQGERLSALVLEAVERHGLPGSSVVIEVTETAVADGNTTIVPTLESLRRNGIKVALDDFGTGQSSLAVLHDLPVDILKIDKSFTNRIDSDREEPVIRAALWLAKSMGLVTVAEGVETESQHAWLIDMGCEMVQGYLFGKPVRSEDLGSLFDRTRTHIQPAPELEDSWKFDDEEAREAAWNALHRRSAPRPTLAEWAQKINAAPNRDTVQLND